MTPVFLALATARIQPQWPDRAQEWTEEFTSASKKYQVGHAYLLDPFMNDQVAWDSEYYLATAVEGYDSPHVHHLTPTRGSLIPANEPTDVGKSYSLSYAFFPLYSWMIWLFTWPLKIFGLTSIATATLAGVIVSALGTLGAMLALYDLTQDSLGEDGAMRAIFYLLIFPSAFFLLQIYTEGLFVGLAFGCLAMIKRKYWLPAALLGIAATLTRAVGIALIIPMAITWIRTGEWMDLDFDLGTMQLDDRCMWVDPGAIDQRFVSRLEASGELQQETVPMPEVIPILDAPEKFPPGQPAAPSPEQVPLPPPVPPTPGKKG